MVELSFKALLLEFCKSNIHSKIERLHKTMKSLETALLSETKSSAGDKHETGRAMIQMEREQLGKQLKELENQAKILSHINPNHPNQVISVGSLVKTSNLCYFIAVGLGKITLHNKTVYAISIISPIGVLLKGKQIGDSVSFRDQKIEVLSII